MLNSFVNLLRPEVSHATSHGRVCWLDGFVTHWSKWYSHPSFALTIVHVLPILKLCSGGQLAQVRWGTVGDMVRVRVSRYLKVSGWSLVDLSLVSVWPLSTVSTLQQQHAATSLGTSPHTPAAASQLSPSSHIDHYPNSLSLQTFLCVFIHYHV